MGFKVIISLTAQKQINQSIDYYEEKQFNLGIRFYADLKNNLRYLFDDPYLFPLKDHKYRELKLSVFPYLIIYEIIDDLVIILAVFNTSKNPIKKPKKL
ncbi:type II toxin-antitoxin system RelE/ParE family toxin [Flavobacterium suzhouense]|uniref:Type II toxin-antitoxin system RelE/ParE family toxin n=1 Tax=Flavobacterium suzhouense TaxID=1529638 RepID=A0ABW5NQ79_9FLAO